MKDKELISPLLVKAVFLVHSSINNTVWLHLLGELDSEGVSRTAKVFNITKATAGRYIREYSHTSFNMYKEDENAIEKYRDIFYYASDKTRAVFVLHATGFNWSTIKKFLKLPSVAAAKKRYKRFVKDERVVAHTKLLENSEFLKKLSPEVKSLS